jgi:hypothetical protein
MTGHMNSIQKSMFAAITLLDVCRKTVIVFVNIVQSVKADAKSVKQMWHQKV